MSSKPKYKEYEEKYKDCMVAALAGNFYNAYGKSAIVLHNILGYKFNNSSEFTLKAGFPEKSITKVITALKEKNVSYVLLVKDQIKQEEHFEENKFNEFTEFDIEIEKKTNNSNTKDVFEIKSFDANNTVSLTGYQIEAKTYERLTEFFKKHSQYNSYAVLNQLIKEAMTRYDK